MIVKKENFWQLKQLDRIEYRQREGLIKSSCESNNIASLIWPFLGVLGFFLLALGVYIKVDVEIAMLLFEAFEAIIQLFIFLAIISFVLDFYYVLKKKKLLKELEEEYFTVEVRKK